MRSLRSVARLKQRLLRDPCLGGKSTDGVFFESTPVNKGNVNVARGVRGGKKESKGE